jgi:hypothetical protein
MIKVTIDPDGLATDALAALVVRDELQYIESRLKIRDAIRMKIAINVIVTNRKIGRWYESLKDYPNVTINVISPKTVLLEALNPPSTSRLYTNFPVHDREIKELELIDKAKGNPPRRRLETIKDIEGWILSVCVDECWSKSGGTLLHLSEMASFFLLMKEYINHPTLERLISRQKETWFDVALSDCYRWLFASPNERAFLIYAWQISKNYDRTMRRNILEEMTTNSQEVLKPIEKYLDEIPFIQCSDDFKGKSQLSDLIQIKWKNVLKSKFEYKKGKLGIEKNEVLKQKFKQIINEAVMRMSGRIVGEINAISFFVKEKPSYFTKELFNLIAGKFNLFPQQIQELDEFIPREFPSEPMVNWDWDQISKWAVDKYFPYKKWSLQHERHNKSIEEIANSYSNWLYMKYPELKNELSPLVYGTWYKIKEYIQKRYQILWIIIDNLCCFYIENTINAFKEQKLFPSSEPLLCLSMLPSETKISKTALVAGNLPSQIDKDNYQNYKLLFKEFCKKNKITDYRVIPENEFRKSKLGAHTITCCIINKLDVSSHGGFFDLEDEIRDFLKRIGKYIKDFLPSDLLHKKFRLIISTDHGSCKIPQNIKGVRLPKGARVEKDKRFVYIDSNQNLDKNWYFLDGNKFALPESIAIVKGYGFIGKRPKGLIHGGMTPEETLIPHLEFCLQPMELKDMQCYHSHSSDPIIGTRKQKVELSIRNLNDYEISNVEVYIPSHSIEIKIEKIPSKDEVSKFTEVALLRDEVVDSKDNMVTLQGYYSFDCRGETKRGKVEVKIKIRKIIKDSETAEEIFKS